MSTSGDAVMAFAALFIGSVIALQGVFGLAVPELFLKVLRHVHTTPVIYLAAVVRVVFGVVLLRAAPTSRAPLFLRALGAAIVLGGLITPFFGKQLGAVILNSWAAGGPSTVRAWAGFSLALGALIVWCVARRAAPARGAA